MEKALNSAMVEERSNEIVARKNEIVDEINAKKEEFDSADTETRESLLNCVEELKKEADELDSEMADLEEQRSTLKAQEERMSLANNLEKTVIDERKNQMENTIDVRSTDQFVKAWRKAVEKGETAEYRTLVSTLGSGTAPIPTYLQGRVEATWQRLSLLNEVSKSFFKGIVAVPYEVSATGAVQHKEGDATPTEETLVIGQTLLQPSHLKKWLRVTDVVESLSDTEFMDYIADEIIYQINLALETAIVNSSATMGVKGIVNSSLVASVTEAISFNAVNDGLAELIEAENPVSIMNRKTFFSNFMALTDLQGRPIYQISTDNANRPAYFVNGVRVLFSNGLKAYDVASANDPYLIVGDLRAYRLNLPNGNVPEIIYDPFTEAEDDVAKYVGKLLCAGDVVRPNNIAVLKKSA